MHSCPHSATICLDEIKEKQGSWKQEIKDQIDRTPLHYNKKKLRKLSQGGRGCLLCPTRMDRWICLACGELFCGRRQRSHTTTHTQKTGHTFFVNVANKLLFCHLCDDYVTFDHIEPQVETMRDYLDKEFPKKTRKNPGSGISDRELKELRQLHIATEKIRSDSAPARKKFDSITGLANLGNTCFMNSVLQTFCHTSLIKKKLKKQMLRKESNKTEVSILVELNKLLDEMWSTSATIISPNAFLNAVWTFVPSFRGYQQQDAQEFIRYLLDRLHTESLLVSSSLPISDIFYGDLMSEVRCLVCQYSSKRKDKFMDLSLPIPGGHHHATKKLKHRLDIHDCLKSMLEEEDLGEDNLYNCPNCKKRQRCTKKLTLGSLPEILCLHLKRFHYGDDTRSKINTFVDFPMLGLDMKEYLHLGSKEHSTAYDLYSCIVHKGNGSSGHFIAYSWSEEQEKWFEFNDSSAIPTTSETISSQHAYMLFYVKRRLADDESDKNEEAFTRDEIIIIDDSDNEVLTEEEPEEEEEEEENDDDVFVGSEKPFSEALKGIKDAASKRTWVRKRANVLLKNPVFLLRMQKRNSKKVQKQRSLQQAEIPSQQGPLLRALPVIPPNMPSLIACKDASDTSDDSVSTLSFATPSSFLLSSFRHHSAKKNLVKKSTCTPCETSVKLPNAASETTIKNVDTQPNNSAKVSSADGVKFMNSTPLPFYPPASFKTPFPGQRYTHATSIPPTFVPTGTLVMPPPGSIVYPPDCRENSSSWFPAPATQEPSHKRIRRSIT